MFCALLEILVQFMKALLPGLFILSFAVCACVMPIGRILVVHASFTAECDDSLVSSSFQMIECNFILRAVQEGTSIGIL